MLKMGSPTHLNVAWGLSSTSSTYSLVPDAAVVLAATAVEAEAAAAAAAAAAVCSTGWFSFIELPSFTTLTSLPSNSHPLLLLLLVQAMLGP
jgi:hypothetical protein